MSDTLFVTGATGLLGNHVVRQLLRQGRLVRALVRDRTKAETQFEDLADSLRGGVNFVEGDVTAVAGFGRALEGVSGLVHTAAYFRESFQGGKHYEAMVRVNVEGTAQLFEHAAQAGVKRFVQISSVGTLKPRKGIPGTTADVRPLQGEPDEYFRSKLLSDAAVERFIAEHPEAQVGFLLPGFMVGPGDLGPTSAGQMVLDFARGRLPGALQARLSFVDARDVAAAAVGLLRTLDDHQGKRFIAAGRCRTLREAYAELQEVTGTRPPKLAIPDWAAYGLAAGMEGYARLTGRPVLLSWAGIRALLRERERSVFDSSPAQQELGVRFRPLRETFADTYADYVRRGWLRAEPGPPPSSSPSAL